MIAVKELKITIQIIRYRRKRLATIHEKDEKIFLYVKGAPESVLEASKRIQKNGEIIQLTKNEIDDFLKINFIFNKIYSSKCNSKESSLSLRIS